MGLRTVGQLLAAAALVAVLVQAYKKWRTRRSIRKLAGRVVLVTGASSGLGEGKRDELLSRLCTVFVS